MEEHCILSQTRYDITEEENKSDATGRMREKNERGSHWIVPQFYGKMGISANHEMQF